MKRLVLFLGIILTTWACERIESGEVPSFPGAFDVAAVSQNQVRLKWSPGSDDLLDPYELRYAIWWEEGVVTFSDNTSPDFVTKKGAHSYNLTGLEPDTTYTVLVRANDGGAYSANTTAKQVTTPTNAVDDYQPLNTFQLASTPTGLVTRRIDNRTSRELGVVFDTSMIFLDLSGTNVGQTASINAGATILEAQMALSGGDTLEDVFILTGNNLRLFLAVATGFQPSAAVFSPLPLADTLSFTVDGDGVLDTLSYVGSGNTGYIYGYILPTDDEPQENQGYGSAATYSLGGPGTFRLGHLDEDEFYDLVSFVDGEVGVALGSDENFEFGTLASLDNVASGEIGAGAFNGSETSVSLFLHDGDGDANLDIFLFFRRATENVTQLWYYQGKGDGSFGARNAVDFDMAFYEDPKFLDFNGSGGPDLVLRQTSSNNLAIFLAPAFSLSSPNLFALGEEVPEDFMVGNFNSDPGTDILMVKDRDLFYLLSK